MDGLNSHIDCYKCCRLLFVEIYLQEEGEGGGHQSAGQEDGGEQEVLGAQDLKVLLRGEHREGVESCQEFLLSPHYYSRLKRKE